MPYSCQLQFGTSGRTGTPVGATSTVRGIARAMSHTSTFTTDQITRRSPPGNCSFGRSTIAEYFARSQGRAIGDTTLFGWSYAPRHASATGATKCRPSLYQAPKLRVNGESKKIARPFDGQFVFSAVFSRYSAHSVLRFGLSSKVARNNAEDTRGGRGHGGRRVRESSN